MGSLHPGRGHWQMPLGSSGTKPTVLVTDCFFQHMFIFIYIYIYTCYLLMIFVCFFGVGETVGVVSLQAIISGGGGGGHFEDVTLWTGGIGAPGGTEAGRAGRVLPGWAAQRWIVPGTSPPS